MNIGVVNFLNAYPLYWALQSKEKINLIRDIPSKLSEGLLSKKLDLAIVSSIEYYKNQNLFNYFDDLCIAADGKVESIRLFYPDKMILGTKGFSEHLKSLDNIKIYYDRATRSSINMLRVIFNEVNNSLKTELEEIHPPFEPYILNLKDDEMILLIGDSALKHRDYASLDMGKIYKEIFGRAFVYAIWVCQKSIASEARDVVYNAYKYARENQDELIKDAVATFGFSEEFTKDYLLNTIQYEFSDKLHDDMNFFFTKAGEIKPL